jgi:hypothetical protein
MQNKKIIDIIKKDAEEILTLANNFAKYHETKIPPIYIELTLSKVKNLYTELQMLNKENEMFDDIVPIEKDHREVHTDVFESDIEKKELLAKGEEAHASDMKSSQTIDQRVKQHGDAISDDQIPSLSAYDVILKKREEHILSTQLKYDSIQNIKDAIDLNKKIWFIKELFHGNIDFYNKTLELLNNFDYLEEALDYVDENFDWDYDNKTVRDFMEFVYRKFI